MDEIMRRNINRRRTTINRYVTDNKSYWREELHARIEDLQPLISNYCEDVARDRINGNIWGFPVDEQSVTNVEDVILAMIDDYFEFVKGRRVWVYTETDGYWTEAKIINTVAYAFIMALWDIGRQMFVSNYPLVEDDLRLRYGKTHSDDERQTYHDSINKLNTGDKKYTHHINERNKIAEHTDTAASDTTNSRSTSNSTSINDVFLSPQNQGVTPSSQSADIMKKGSKQFQSPDTHGVSGVEPNGNPAFTTNTSNVFEGSTDTGSEGRTSTSGSGHRRVDERDNIQADDTTTSDKGAENNVGAKALNATGHERQETLDIAGVLQNFYDLFKDRLMMEIDNRMLPYYLNMKISRFKDHTVNRKEYV